MGGQQQSSLSAVFRLGRPAAWLLWCVKTARFATGKFGITFGTEPRNWVNTSVYPAIFSKLVTWRKCLLNFGTKERGGKCGWISSFSKASTFVMLKTFFIIISSTPSCLLLFYHQPFCNLLFRVSFLKIETGKRTDEIER